ncbi:cell division protein ZipA [Agrilutibacter solisilvae]|uniref:Cell division protein ZipA n=1 Tax=Agrilutibacter solisilvae TaxID=2763317 RepID=A0A974XYV8_9GAMM|nr:cell division protein ZipA [Lysobacter solisilvae]QSX77385.1 cell division protein ZipA [Lysobacter solisilvae]
MSDVTLLRVGILIAGLILVGAIIFFGRPRKPGQGKRVPRAGFADGGARAEPYFPGDAPTAPATDEGLSTTATQAELALDADADAQGEHAQADAAASDVGKRNDMAFEKIITLYLAARAGSKLHGPDIVVAAEKAGLVYGHMGVFHRLIDNHHERGPVFSVANIMKPGSFEMATIQSMETPAIAFFLTLPSPVPALDAWETMLPTAQRMAELLDGVVLDESRNALGRQRIAHIRDELRAWDRQHEMPPLTKPARW